MPMRELILSEVAEREVAGRIIGYSVPEALKRITFLEPSFSEVGFAPRVDEPEQFVCKT